MKRLVLACILLGLVSSAEAAGTVTVARTAVPNSKFIRYTVSWTATAGGAVSGNGFAVRSGYIVSVRFVPGATTPTNLYDVTLVDSDGTITSTDLLAAAGGDRSSTLANLVTLTTPIFEDGTRTLDVVVANAGDSKTGTVIILVELK